jgi:SAM-dependent methyltransferase
MYKLYTELAKWWPLVSAVQDYVEEAAFFGARFQEAGLAPAPTLLELGCGGGNNAYFLKKLFAQVTLTDLSADMLAVSQALNPECEHIQGDMRSLRLGRQFDAVFIHDAIMYMTSVEDLRRALETAAVHCKPGGAAVFVPDCVRETFQPASNAHGLDGQGRSIRYLEWAYDPDEGDNQYLVEFAYLLREDGQPLVCEHETQRFGLFARGEWLRLLDEVGFSGEAVRDEYGRDVFAARRRAG